ncbi:MAG: M23 family metallopeptidase [Candidatus Omnitrophica bacterium]|nr:M23 family metallopeptidase [Candidatus Omnitrophota bacterium]
MKFIPVILVCFVSWRFALPLEAQALHFPTANHALLEPDGAARFFVGTPGKPWTSGSFGCVRSEGHQLHEGIDIKCLQKNKRGEPIDPVMAAADGVVAYVSRKPWLSNYGNYVVLQHCIDGLEVYSLYAHLSEIHPTVKPGQRVKAGETIGTMGRTSNTRSGISKDRAHLHFELVLFMNEHFATWQKKTFPHQRNDHGIWNGRNLVGLDPRLIFLEQSAKGSSFDLAGFVRNRTPLCRVLVRKTGFPWLKRYALFARRNPLAEKEGVAGYEITLDYDGVPFDLVPRAGSEIKSKTTYQLLYVNEPEEKSHPCRHFLVRRNQHWALTRTAIQWLDLLTY